ncbi:Aa-trans domain-containing protein [Aphelenchoides fujianensis]|nr:Aa-trans domain-containing protein [Aphelenchoides fujianensis]
MFGRLGRITFLILSARILSDLAASALNLKLSSCRMLVILALLFWPIIFFRSPADFWLIVLVAMGATFVASGVILVGAALDYPVCGPVARLPSFNLSESLLSLGVFMFSFGVVFLLYGSITAMGVLTYGDGLADTIITSIQHSSMRQWANLGIAVHCLLTLTITLNPLCQELEEALDVPHEFCFKRVAIRSGLLFSVTFTALSFPSFGAILERTTVALTSAVFPCLFNLSLRAFEHGGSVKKHGWLEMSRIIVSRTSWWRLLINGFIIAFATICGLVTTRSAIRELALATFSPPCYFASTHVLPTPHFVHCCGPHRNVSALLSNQCPS